MEYKFCINDFEGPLDLLLHLVKTSQLDIYEIDIRLIIDEYLDFIEKEKNNNIDIASSYLVMAAELIHLKSKMLINDDSKEDNSDEYHFDSEEDLRKKIIEYEKYQKITATFQELENKRNNFYTKSPMSLDEFLAEKKLNLGTVCLNDLLEALKNVQTREKYLKPLNTKITKREYSIEKRINDIRQILNIRKKVEFNELFVENNREFLIVTFLSILTMSKNAEILLTQEKNFLPIIIERRELHE